MNAYVYSICHKTTCCIFGKDNDLNGVNSHAASTESNVY